jgi:hypothetical protein
MCSLMTHNALTEKKSDLFWRKFVGPLNPELNRHVQIVHFCESNNLTAFLFCNTLTNVSPFYPTSTAILPLKIYFVTILLISRSQNSSFSIATGYGLEDQGVGVRVKNFLFSTLSKLALGSTQPPIQWVPGLFPRG